jgi:hypothetical protein
MASSGGVVVGDESADEFGGVGENGVAEGATSVHPSGNPISHSIHVGFDGPPRTVRRFFPPLRRSEVPGPPLASEAVGVGQDEQAGPWVWGAHLASSEIAGADAVSGGSEVGVNSAESSGPQTGHVLPDHPGGSEGEDDGVHGRPEPPWIVLSESGPGETGGLAGEAAGDNVNGRAWPGLPPLDTGTDVVMAGHLRPVMGQHLLAERVVLHLADHAHPGAFQSEVEAADTGEQRQHV